MGHNWISKRERKVIPQNTLIADLNENCDQRKKLPSKKLENEK